MAVVPRIGTEFAGYRIESLLGRGGMSVVYRAENVRLGNKVALKLLAEELAEDESFRERFVRESRTAASLNHPNIVPIYDAGDWEGVLYIAMRWVEGDLKAQLRRDGPLAPDHAIAVAAQVGSALDVAHARGLLHRDVKPANILVEPGEPGAPPIAYLADFGLTKHLESRSGITASGQFVGTIDYMSPEQIEGREVDARTDIYSLGCVIFESLAGATPFRRETEVAVLWAHMREEPPPLSELRPDLPREVDGVLAKAMAKDPDQRYGSCRELVAALRHVLGPAAAATYAGRTVGEVNGEAPVPTTVRQPRRSRNAPRLLPALGILGALLVAGAVGAVAYAVIGDEPQVIAAEGTTLTLNDEILLQRIPAPIRGRCRPTEPLTPDFDSRMLCRLGTREVDRVEYNLAKSGNRMRAYFLEQAFGEQLATPGEPVRALARCGPDSQAIGAWKPAGETGHSDRLRRGDTSSGRFLCYRRNGWAGMEWTDARRDIYSAAYGRDLRRLFGWWRQSPGPTA
jgi:serine/threonine-protein kinase